MNRHHVSFIYDYFNDSYGLDHDRYDQDHFCSTGIERCASTTNRTSHNVAGINPFNFARNCG